MFRIMSWLISPSWHTVVIEFVSIASMMLGYGLWLRIIRRMNWNTISKTAGYHPFTVIAVVAGFFAWLFYQKGRVTGILCPLIGTILLLGTFTFAVCGLFHDLAIVSGYVVGLMAVLSLEDIIQKIARWHHPTTPSC